MLQERWKVKQEQGRLQGLQTALEDERRMWTEQQARERANMEKSRVSINLACHCIIKNLYFILSSIVRTV